MQNSHKQSGPITIVISEIVEPDRIQEYEVWAKQINLAAQQFDGFLGVDVIRPRDALYPEYVVIVKFNSYAACKSWLMSPTYTELIERSRDLVSVRSFQQLPSGLELWFTLPETATKMPQPAFYKQVILGVLAVYPLILIANWLLGPLLQGFPPLLGLLFSVIFVSALLTYPVMPWLTKLLGFWLYPSSVRKRTKR